MVNRGDVLATLWTDRATIVANTTVEDEDGVDRTEPHVLAEDVPCRISLVSLKSDDRGITQEKERTNKLFLGTTAEVPAGADITVTRVSKDGKVWTLGLERAGPCMPYSYHQEIQVEVTRDWA